MLPGSLQLCEMVKPGNFSEPEDRGMDNELSIYLLSYAVRCLNRHGCPFIDIRDNCLAYLSSFRLLHAARRGTSLDSPLMYGAVVEISAYSPPLSLPYAHSLLLGEI